MMKAGLLSLICALGLGAPAAAQSWVDEIVSVEVLDGGATAEGTHRAALKFTLADGWKTYWRAPGDAGIPPHFSWKGSRNLGGVEILWPTPHVFDQNGMRSIGYAGELVLPVDITPRDPGEPLRLKGEVEIGVCKDVCIPASLRFDTGLDPAAPRHPSILAARANRPLTASEARVGRVTCALSPNGSGLRLEARIDLPSTGAPEVAVFEPGDPQIWASEAQTTRRGGTLVAVSDLIHVSGGAFGLDRSRIRITVLGRARAVDIQGCSAG